MKLKETLIQGLYVIEYDVFSDLRGELQKPYSARILEGYNLNHDFKEFIFTRSKKDVLRGMHYQAGEMASEKLVSVMKGRIRDVVLDVREDSKTFGQFFSLDLEEGEGKTIYIPRGCAHGYRVLENNSITAYLITEVFSPENDNGYRWDSFGYDWGIKNPILSEKDQNLPLFK